MAVELHRVAERLDERRLSHHAEQLRGAGLSLTNNMAEGSGSVHRQECIQFLNLARRSLFEDASMLLVFERLGLIPAAEVGPLLQLGDKLSRTPTNLARTRQKDQRPPFALPSCRLTLAFIRRLRS